MLSLGHLCTEEEDGASSEVLSATVLVRSLHCGVGS